MTPNTLPKPKSWNTGIRTAAAIILIMVLYRGTSRLKEVVHPFFGIMSFHSQQCVLDVKDKNGIPPRVVVVTPKGDTANVFLKLAACASYHMKLVEKRRRSSLHVLLVSILVFSLRSKPYS